MTRIKVDLDKVESGFEPMEAGNYRFRCESFVDGKTNDGKKKMFKGVLVITEEPYEGRKLWPNFVQEADSMWFLKRFFQAVGLDWNDPDFDTTDVAGVEGVVKVADGKEYQGKITSQAKDFFPIE